MFPDFDFLAFGKTYWWALLAPGTIGSVLTKAWDQRANRQLAREKVEADSRLAETNRRFGPVTKTFETANRWLIHIRTELDSLAHTDDRRLLNDWSDQVRREQTMIEADLDTWGGEHALELFKEYTQSLQLLAGHYGSIAEALSILRHDPDPGARDRAAEWWSTRKNGEEATTAIFNADAARVAFRLEMQNATRAL